jgi:hypothetical protein
MPVLPRTSMTINPLETLIGEPSAAEVTMDLQ